MTFFEKNSALVWVGVAVIAGVLVLGLVKWQEDYTANAPANPLVAQAQESDHVKGNPDAEVIIVEYGDYQCPACSVYHPVVEEVFEAYPEQVAVVYRHFPLRQIHPNAQVASQAAEAAGLQGKFWEMHDRLFEGQDEWAADTDPTEDFVVFASELGLDVEKFRTDLASDEVQKVVDDMYKSGESVGVAGTPTFFLNGELIDNPRTVDEFKELVAAELGGAEDTE